MFTAASIFAGEFKFGSTNMEMTCQVDYPLSRTATKRPRLHRAVLCPTVLNDSLKSCTLRTESVEYFEQIKYTQI